MVRSPLAKNSSNQPSQEASASPADGQLSLKLAGKEVKSAEVGPSLPKAGAKELPTPDEGLKANRWEPASVSEIKDLNNHTKNLASAMDLIPPATHTMFDAGARSRSKWMRIGFWASLVAGLAWTVQSDWFVQMVILPVQFKLASSSTVDERSPGGRGSRVKGPGASQKNSATKNPAKPSPALQKLPNLEALTKEILAAPLRQQLPNCKNLVDQYLSSDESLGFSQNLNVAECLMLMQDYQGASKAVGIYLPALRQIGDSSMNPKKDFEPAADLMNVLVESYLFSGATRNASEIVRGRCPRWQASHPCVAKLLIYGVQKIPLDREAASLFGVSGTLPPAAEARLWLAGAMIAANEGKGKVVDQRLKLALAVVPPRAQHLKRRIFDFGATELYYRGALISLKSFAARAVSDLKGSANGGLIKLRFLNELAASENKKKVLKNYLSQSEAVSGLGKDPELIDILGSEALRQNLFDDWLNFLKEARAAKVAKPSHESFDLLRASTLWTARTLLAQGQYLPVLKLLNDPSLNQKNDYVVAHLRGITYFLLSDQSHSQLGAMSELARAYRLKKNWESLVVLGFALTKAGKLDRVASVIKDLNFFVTTSGQKYWLDLLKGEYYLAQGKLINTQKTANDMLYAEPQAILPRLLLIRALSLAKDSDGVKKQQALLEEATRKKPYNGSFEALASPFGPLSVTRRPID